MVIMLQACYGYYVVVSYGYYVRSVLWLLC